MLSAKQMLFCFAAQWFILGLRTTISCRHEILISFWVFPESISGQFHCSFQLDDIFSSRMPWVWLSPNDNRLFSSVSATFSWNDYCSRIQTLVNRILKSCFVFQLLLPGPRSKERKTEEDRVWNRMRREGRRRGMYHNASKVRSGCARNSFSWHPRRETFFFIINFWNEGMNDLNLQKRWNDISMDLTTTKNNINSDPSWVTNDFIFNVGLVENF